MKKLVLAAILELGVFVAGCATADTAAKIDKTTNAKAENLSNELLDYFLSDCINNENKTSCQRLVDSDMLASVEQCNKNTCNNLGRVFDATANYQQAMKYYQKAGDLGDAFGYHNMGILYDNGQGVQQNFHEAFKSYKKACDLNFAPACANIGNLYQQGQGVRQDFVNARKYFEKACNANKAMACNNLGVLYANGQGVKQNLSTAKQYYGKACDLGSQNGCDNYKILNEQGVK